MLGEATVPFPNNGSFVALQANLPDLAKIPPQLGCCSACGKRV
jgi:hypothetical protein